MRFGKIGFTISFSVILVALLFFWPRAHRTPVPSQDLAATPQTLPLLAAAQIAPLQIQHLPLNRR